MSLTEFNFVPSILIKDKWGEAIEFQYDVENMFVNIIICIQNIKFVLRNLVEGKDISRFYGFLSKIWRYAVSKCLSSALVKVIKHIDFVVRKIMVK